jgi:hypothetical protein
MDALDVHLHVYDLSQGLAAQLSPVLLGRQVDGVWHTAIVVGGIEFYFGNGVSAAKAGQTRFGTPGQVWGHVLHALWARGAVGEGECGRGRARSEAARRFFWRHLAVLPPTFTAFTFHRPSYHIPPPSPLSPADAEPCGW